MHGIAELIAIFGFVATFVVAFVAHRLGGRRSVPILLLVGIWPLIVLVVIQKGRFFDQPHWWGFYLLVALTITAAFLGAACDAFLSRRKAQR